MAKTMKDICIVDCHARNYDELAAFTVYQNRDEYCARHGYDLVVNKAHTHDSNFAFDRLHLVRDLLKQTYYKWVYLCGTDILITNLSIPLSTFTDETSDLIGAGDCFANINADSLLFRSSIKSIRLLNKIISMKTVYINHVWKENQALIDLVNVQYAKTTILPQRRLNAYDYKVYMSDSRFLAPSSCDLDGNDGQWKHGDFLIHFPGISLKEKIENLHKYIPHVVR